MKRTVVDYLRRWAWVYVLGFVCHLGAMALAFVKWDVTVIAAVFAGSAFVLMAETNRMRGSRTLLSLPMTSGDVARVWRFVALEFPVLWYLFALLLAAGLVAAFGPEYAAGSEQPPVTLGRFALLFWLQTVALGVVFFLCTGMQLGGQGHNVSAWRTFRDGLFGLLWGGIVFAVVMLWQYLPGTFREMEALHWGVMVVLTGLTAFGWVRAESVVLKRLNFLKEPTAPASVPSGTSGESKLASIKAALVGPSGLRVNVLQFATTNGLFGIFILAFNWVVIHHMVGHPEVDAGDSGRIDIGLEQVGLFMPIFAMIAGMASLTQLRVMCSLPMAKGALAAYLVVWPLMVGVVFGLVAVLIYALWFGGGIAWSVYQSGLLACAVLLAGLPVVLRFGFGLKSIIVLVVLMPLVQFVHVLRRELEDSWLSVLYPQGAWSVLAVLLLSAGSWWWCRHLLDSSHPWREGALRMRNQRRF